MPSDASRSTWDVVIVGGGLQGGLLARALADSPFSPTVLLVERSSRLGGNHTWSFHVDDVAPDAWRWLDAFLSARWPRYHVRFPDRARTLEGGYCTILSSDFHRTLSEFVERHSSIRLSLGAMVTSLSATAITLDNGATIQARQVVDARGPVDPILERRAGFQKFVGLEIEFDNAPPLDGPMVMDATIPQRDGFRFFYILPLTSRRWLVEDTCYADGPDLDMDRFRDEIFHYARARGASGGTIIREESGVLPIPWRPVEELASAADAPLALGYRGGWYHPTTGYSVPLAVRLATLLGRTPIDQWPAALAVERQRIRPRVQFCRLLNFMLFRSFAPQDRWNVLSRFYGLSPSTISRFYALELTRRDRLAIVCGRPPKGFSIRQTLSERKIG